MFHRQTQPLLIGFRMYTMASSWRAPDKIPILFASRSTGKSSCPRGGATLETAVTDVIFQRATTCVAFPYISHVSAPQQYGHQQFGGQPGMVYNPQMGMYPQGFIPQQGMPMAQVCVCVCVVYV